MIVCFFCWFLRGLGILVIVYQFSQNTFNNLLILIGMILRINNRNSTITINLFINRINLLTKLSWLINKILIDSSFQLHRRPSITRRLTQRIIVIINCCYSCIHNNFTVFTFLSCKLLDHRLTFKQILLLQVAVSSTTIIVFVLFGLFIKMRMIRLSMVNSNNRISFVTSAFVYHFSLKNTTFIFLFFKSTIIWIKLFLWFFILTIVLMRIRFG